MATLPLIVAGDDYSVVATLTQDGATWDITGSTVTATIRDGEHPGTALIANHAVTLTTAATGIVTLTLTDTETDNIRTLYDPRKALIHFCDFLVVDSSSNEAHSETFDVPARRKVT